MGRENLNGQMAPAMPRAGGNVFQPDHRTGEGPGVGTKVVNEIGVRKDWSGWRVGSQGQSEKKGWERHVGSDHSGSGRMLFQVLQCIS